MDNRKYISKVSQDVLNLMDECRIFYISDEYNNGILYIGEGCDGYFHLDLTPKICADLACLFSELSIGLKPKNK